MAKILRALFALTLAIFSVTEIAAAQTAPEPPNPAMPPATALPHPQAPGATKKCQQTPNGPCKKNKKKKKKSGKNKKQATSSSLGAPPGMNAGQGMPAPAATPRYRDSKLGVTESGP